MMKKTTAAALIAMVILVGGLFAAPARSVQVRSAFPRPPQQAAQALKVTAGKPFSSGYVFVDGRYLTPPYKVERYGTVIRINGCQVTREIVPWSEFVKTQAGFTAVKSEAPDEGEDESAEEETPADSAEPEEEEEEEVDEDDSTLDDLFDDSAEEKKPVAKKKPVTDKKPKKRKPQAKITYSFAGEFTPNEKTKAMVDKINRIRTKIDSQLRAGGYYFFGSRYSTLNGDAGAAKRLAEKLPVVMQKYSERGEFAAAIRSAGFTYFPVALVDDLFKNRFAYIQLLERRKKDLQQNQWQKLLVD